MTAAPVMKIGALAPWFGGKRTLAPRIVAELGPHRAYWEPMVGGFSVISSKPVAPFETVNDLHGDVVNLARIVAHPELGPDLFERLSRVMPAEALMADAAARYAARGYANDLAEPDLDRAADYFVVSWLGRNGVSGTHSYNQGFCVRYTARGGSPSKRFLSAVQSLPAWYERLRNVTILRRDAFTLIADIADDPATVIYLDPPYVVKGSTYIHDFKPDDDCGAGLFCDDAIKQPTHRRLRDLLARFRQARVVVSYYDHPLVRELYKGWTFVDCTMAKNMVNQGMRDAKVDAKAPELLIVNGPSLTAGGEW